MLVNSAGLVRYSLYMAKVPFRCSFNVHRHSPGLNKTISTSGMIKENMSIMLYFVWLFFHTKMMELWVSKYPQFGYKIAVGLVVLSLIVVSLHFLNPNENTSTNCKAFHFRRESAFNGEYTVLACKKDW